MDIYRDVHTGAEFHERPCLRALRAVIRAGGIDVVLCHSLDRLSRRQVHVAILADECERHGARLDFVTEDFERSVVGEFIRSAKAFAAEVEREKLLERTARGRRARVEQGAYSCGNTPPYGYAWVNERKAALIPDPVTAPVVRRIFHELAEGTSARKLVGHLAADGVLSPRGRPYWSTKTISAIVKHPVYVGRPTAFRWNKTKGSGNVRMRPPEEQLVLDPSLAPAIVDQDLAAAAVARLRVNKLEAARNNHTPEAGLLRAGYSVCGYCGGNLVVHRLPDGRTQYRCCRRGPDRTCPSFAVDTGVLDRAVWDRVERVLLRPETVAAEVARLRAADPTVDDREAIRRRVAEIERQRANAAKKLILFDDEEAAAPLVALMASLKDQKQQAEQELADLERQRAGWEATQGRLDELAHWCGQVAVNLRLLSHDQRRTALQALGVKARAWRADHTPRYDISLCLDIVEPSSWSACILR